MVKAMLYCGCGYEEVRTLEDGKDKETVREYSILCSYCVANDGNYRLSPYWRDSAGTIPLSPHRAIKKAKKEKKKRPKKHSREKVDKNGFRQLGKRAG